MLNFKIIQKMETMTKQPLEALVEKLEKRNAMKRDFIVPSSKIIEEGKTKEKRDRNIVIPGTPLKVLQGYELDNAIAAYAIRKFLERWRKKFKKSLRHWLVTELGHNGIEKTVRELGSAQGKTENEIKKTLERFQKLSQVIGKGAMEQVAIEEQATAEIGRASCRERV